MYTGCGAAIFFSSSAHVVFQHTDVMPAPTNITGYVAYMLEEQTAQLVRCAGRRQRCGCSAKGAAVVDGAWIGATAS